MKQNIAYYLLLLYLSVMFRSVMPLIGDSAAHFFAAAYHEATVHARFGAHHVDKEISSSAAENANNKQQSMSRAEDPIPHLPEDLVNIHSLTASISYSFNSFRDPFLPGIIYSVQSPPPRFI